MEGIKSYVGITRVSGIPMTLFNYYRSKEISLPENQEDQDGYYVNYGFKNGDNWISKSKFESLYNEVTRDDIGYVRNDKMLVERVFKTIEAQLHSGQLENEDLSEVQEQYIALRNVLKATDDRINNLIKRGPKNPGEGGEGDVIVKPPRGGESSNNH